jgi:hypothetical protein
MINKFFALSILSLCSLSLSAQERPYTLTIQDTATPITPPAKEKLTAAFNKVYPWFAAADGYRTQRNATLTFSATKTETISAKEGAIIINEDWLKGKSQRKIENELRAAFIKNWTDFSTQKKKGYQLTFISKDPGLNAEVKQKLIDTYFEIYPTLVKTFNKKSTHDVLFVVDTAYKAVAEASGKRILFSANYLKAHPTDIDVVTHETMHLVQGYGYDAGPVWLTEGIADYVRYKYGVDNVGSKWSLPAYNSKQSYQNSYRITARFFAWLSQNVKADLIPVIDQQLRVHTYSEQSWVKLTGKTIDELWNDYAKNPDRVTLIYSDKSS